MYHSNPDRVTDRVTGGNTLVIMSVTVWVYGNPIATDCREDTSWPER